MRTPAEHKVFQWIYWEKKYGKPVFKIFWYGRSDRFYPGNAGDVFLVNLDCVHAWNFSGTCAGADEISRKKAGSPREPDLDGSTSGRHRTAHIYAFEKKGPFGALRWVFTIKGMVAAQVLIITPIVCGMVYSYAVRTAPSIRAFARTMGADRHQTARLLLREMKNEIYFAVVSGYGRSISEVGAVFLVGGNIKNSTRTMTTAISTLKGAGDYYEGVFLGVILMLLAFAVQTLAEHFRQEETPDENL